MASVDKPARRIPRVPAEFQESQRLSASGPVDGAVFGGSSTKPAIWHIAMPVVGAVHRIESADTVGASLTTRDEYTPYGDPPLQQTQGGEGRA